MDPLSQAIAEWQGFYAAVAGVGATLVGLVYVGITIHLGRLSWTIELDYWER
jgi:hypothetical protein